MECQKSNRSRKKIEIPETDIINTFKSIGYVQENDEIDEIINDIDEIDEFDELDEIII